MRTTRIIAIKVCSGMVFFFAIIAVPALAAPPRVIRTLPESGQKDVDPKLRQIRIQFDQDMNQQGYSICGGGPKYPKTIGEPRWTNKRTIAMRVELEPDHEYKLSVNCQSYKNFRNLQGESAIIYPIQFRTGSLGRPDKSKALPLAGNGPPEVIETVPENGAKNVDPSLQEIRVVFNQDMSTGKGGFSICGGGPKFPNIIGDPQWVDKRTIVMQVQLSPNHQYQFSINCPSAKNFRSAKGEPAAPYPIKFRTGSGRAKASVLITANNDEAIKELRQAIDEKYSYRDLRGVDWDSMFDKYTALMERAGSPLEFAEIAAKLLAHAEDMHIWLKVDGETIKPFKRNIRQNYNRNTLSKAVPGWQKRSAAIYTGKYDDGIGYILIDSWSRDRADALEQAYEAIWEHAEAPGLIIDVRSNNGGAEPLAREVAGCFVDEPVIYAKHIYRELGGFGKERELRPNKRRPKYRGKIAVLMGQTNMSSCEAFLLMMKQVPNCKLVGDKSYGSSGNPKPVDLGNAVTVWLPSWKALRPDGTCFEGKGIEPDVFVRTAETQLSKSDRVLETALRLLRKF